MTRKDLVVGALTLLAACTGDVVDKAIDTDTEIDTQIDSDTDVVDTDALDLYDYAALPEMVTFEPGTFTMGSADEELGHTSVEILHEVTLTYRFEVARYEVMQAQFEAATSTTPSFWGGCRRCPVETVSWDMAAAYTNRLSTQAGLPACYTCTTADSTVTCESVEAFGTCLGYRLPTEAEWEYAARSSGTVTGPTPGGGGMTTDGDRERCTVPLLLDDGTDLGAQAWFCGNSDGTPGNTTRPAGRLAANAAGVSDMVGNVWEWVHDGWRDDISDATNNPFGPATAETRTVRGGGWNSSAGELRCAFRTVGTPSNTNDNLGFRVARRLPE